MSYLPIAEHGVIGNLRTVALIGTNGSVDWYCYPQFDSPSVFGSILDDKKGGEFRIAPVDKPTAAKQFYWPDTNVLVTRFMTSDGVAEVTDFMPMGEAAADLGDQILIRRVRVPRGAVKLRVVCRPAFDYARARHSLDIQTGCATFSTPALTLALVTPIALERTDGDGVSCEFVLKESETAVFILGRHRPDVRCPDAIDQRAEALFQTTVKYWRHWLSKSTYTGRWREMVHRSVLVLKLMTFEPTGAIVAAPTAGLPEVIGGGRNWDYRFSWIRDAAFTVYAFMRIGFTDEARDFMSWLERCFKGIDGQGGLQVVYTIDGGRDMPETTLGHLDGYCGSKPVRIGNAASKQLQLDIYGELLDAVYLWNKYGTPVNYDGWVQIRTLVNWLCDNWKRKDEGIWEIRGVPQAFVYSRMMTWVAIDRAIRLADKRSFPADRARWLAVRDEVYEEVMREGWDAERHTFVQFYGSKALDASALIMPLVFFLSPTDPRMIGTLRAINRPPCEGGLVSDGLVFRYDTDTSIDGVTGSEGTFNLCTFWLVEALTRAGRAYPEMLEEARLLFERILGYANHLGLYSEEIGPSGEHLGNFPQAFTHLSLISAAFNLDRALQNRR